ALPPMAPSEMSTEVAPGGMKSWISRTYSDGTLVPRATVLYALEISSPKLSTNLTVIRKTPEPASEYLLAVHAPSLCPVGIGIVRAMPLKLVPLDPRIATP